MDMDQQLLGWVAQNPSLPEAASMFLTAAHSSSFDVPSSKRRQSQADGWGFDETPLAPAKLHRSPTEYYREVKSANEGGLMGGSFVFVDQDEMLQLGGYGWPDKDTDALLEQLLADLPSHVRERAMAFHRDVERRLDALKFDCLLLPDGSVDADQEQERADESCLYTISASDKRALKDELKARLGAKIAAAAAQKFEKNRKEALPEAARAAMKAEYAHNDYPSTEWKEKIAATYSLTSRQVNDWFNNERKRRPHAKPGSALTRPRRVSGRGPRVSLAESPDETSD